MSKITSKKCKKREKGYANNLGGTTRGKQNLNKRKKQRKKERRRNSRRQ
jgi:hypothetical protein